MMVEELAAIGVQRIVAVDFAGSIDQSVPSGSVVLAEGAIALDGTSRHYSLQPIAPASRALTAPLAAHLAERGVELSCGLVWSTDAVYRETRSQIEAQRAQGALCVDMETAALYAVASALGLEAVSLLVAADELFESWQAPRDMRSLQRRLWQLGAIAVGYLQK
jgi:uridine phosphorylase